MGLAISALLNNTLIQLGELVDFGMNSGKNLKLDLIKFYLLF